MRNKTWPAAVLTACAFLSIPAHAQEAFPSRPITFVVPFPAGGVTDQSARLLARKLSDDLGVPLVVENRAGASGIVGTQYAARAKPDGYTLLFGAAGTLATNPWLYRNLPYSPEQSFEPIGVFSESPLVLVTAKTHNFKSVQQLVAYAKQNPEKLTFGSAGPGSAMNMASEMLQRSSGTKSLHVPFKGSADAMTALLSGTIDYMFDYAVSVTPQVRSGAIVALATTSTARLKELPGVPTTAEAGLPDVRLSSWFGLLAPAGTPRDIIAKLEGSLRKTLRDPEFRRGVESQGSAVVENITGAAFGQFIKTEKERWKDLVEAAGVKPE
ncbi:tripartite tricarboxylate transporter substrate binding protein [Hydrogenophaga sp.]|uniref:Bug family tripartite tricarboxylate transporter substrate binding protein n=1 Tax=Hydrogenophaga sp. TaxID=1904254 RepID=UPI002717170B|nr:tripartite tricarboxylate transporter substrate binding protein [Hydrogenophaga sp.]MDO9435383.1 tripartite tricarboxylate transporter substrate binding protein [Hydrogenophaga sp.]